MLKVQDLTVYYGAVQALKGIHFCVPKGSIVALVGANGAGKTTTMRALSGLVRKAKGTVEFATMTAADSTIWKYLGPLCFHSWWSENIPNNEFERIAAFAKAWNKPVWCSELGFDAMAWKVRGMDKTWDYAFRFAKISHRMMKYAEVEVSMYWTWQNNYPIMSADTKTKYPSYYVTRHYTDFLNSGTQILHSSSSDPEILAICGRNVRNETIIQVINLKKETVTIEVEGISTTLLRHVSSTENDLWKVDVTTQINKNGNLIQLQPVSVNTVIFAK